jgi:hypothetical protein
MKLSLLSALALVLWGVTGGLRDHRGRPAAYAQDPAALQVKAVDYEHKQIYHSPETPGYTSWVGLWQTAEGRLQCSFQQLTGPKDKPVGSVPILESTDEGLTWTRVPGDVPVGGGRGMAVLKEGTLVRPHWASDPQDAGWVERSTDGGKTWGEHIYFLSPQEYRTWPTLIRPLRDGRLVLMAGCWKRGDGEIPNPRMTKMMFVSRDEGKTWGEPIVLMPTETGVCEESDFCELPDGDLFWIHRVEHFPREKVELPPLAAPMGGDAWPWNGYSDRMQSLVRKQGDGWLPEPPTPAPFPHSGFPEVVRTLEGLILHLATDGIYWTADVGRTWTRLDLPGTGYYPRALQLSSGWIVCLGHVGSDDVYGTVDQSIVMDRFRLEVIR